MGLSLRHLQIFHYHIFMSPLGQMIPLFGYFWLYIEICYFRLIILSLVITYKWYRLIAISTLALEMYPFQLLPSGAMNTVWFINSDVLILYYFKQCFSSKFTFWIWYPNWFTRQSFSHSNLCIYVLEED